MDGPDARKTDPAREVSTGKGEERIDQHVSETLGGSPGGDLGEMPFVGVGPVGRNPSVHVHGDPEAAQRGRERSGARRDDGGREVPARTHPVEQFEQPDLAASVAQIMGDHEQMRSLSRRGMAVRGAPARRRCTAVPVGGDVDRAVQRSGHPHLT